MSSVKTQNVKFEHQKFLQVIPDDPWMPIHVTATRSNSILGQLAHMKSQGIYNCDGIFDLAADLAQVLRLGCWPGPSASKTHHVNQANKLYIFDQINQIIRPWLFFWLD